MSTRGSPSVGRSQPAAAVRRTVGAISPLFRGVRCQRTFTCTFSNAGFGWHDTVGGWRQSRALSCPARCLPLRWRWRAVSVPPSHQSPGRIETRGLHEVYPRSGRPRRRRHVAPQIPGRAIHVSVCPLIALKASAPPSELRGQRLLRTALVSVLPCARQSAKPVQHVCS